MPRAPVSARQYQVAKQLRITLEEESFDVAAARLLDALADVIGQDPAKPCTEAQRAFAESLAVSVQEDSCRVASAKIGEVLYERNQRAIRDLDLRPGDAVVRVHHMEFDGQTHTLETDHVVSSIGENARVFFKGGNGQGAWPTQLRKTVAP